MFLFLFVAAPFVLYVVARIVTLAYFNSKRDYVKGIMDHGANDREE